MQSHGKDIKRSIFLNSGQSVTSSIMQGSAGGMMGMPGYGTAGGVPAVQQPTDHVNLMNMMQAKSVNIQPMQFTSNLNVNPEFMTKEMEAFDQVTFLSLVG